MKWCDLKNMIHWFDPILVVMSILTSILKWDLLPNGWVNFMIVYECDVERCSEYDRCRYFAFKKNPIILNNVTIHYWKDLIEISMRLNTTNQTRNASYTKMHLIQYQDTRDLHNRTPEKRYFWSLTICIESSFAHDNDTYRYLRR